MGSLKSSNDFLPKSEIERTLYNRRKPIILLVMVMFLVFNLVGCAVQGLAVALCCLGYPTGADRSGKV